MAKIHRILSVLFAISLALVCFAQTDLRGYSRVSAPDSTLSSLLIDRPDFDSLLTVQSALRLRPSAAYFRPAVFDTYQLLDTIKLDQPGREQNYPFSGTAFDWVRDMEANKQLIDWAKQNYMVRYPLEVKYNQSLLPQIPKLYTAHVDPRTSKITFEEAKIADVKPAEVEANVERRHWIHRFDASLQFSQAYISPNWYQGGNNNLNMIGLIQYNVKLNQKFYPKYLFEVNLSYKVGVNNAPDDSIHSVNITEDIFQFNLTAGLKAFNRWYYSANVMFKTQLLNSYPTNSRQLRSAFMSPGELNFGLGMTYNYTSPKKNVVIGASISPLSWNLKTCTNRRMNPQSFDIEEGHRTKNKIGSSGEFTMMWKIAYNIVYNTRLFAFTDYDYAYADWEHTIDFNINRFLTTRLYLHMRYDTSTPKVEDSNWHKFQFKEIFSFGFAYHFGA